MDEKYTELAIHVQEIDSRCKSNEHRINDTEKAIGELRNRQEAIYELTSSVKSIAQDMSYIKEDVSEVKVKQTELNNKVTILENRPAHETKKIWDSIYEKLLWFFIVGIAGFLLGHMLPGVF